MDTPRPWTLWIIAAAGLCAGAVLYASTPVYVPAYGGRYVGTDDGLLRELLAEVKAIRAEIKFLCGQRATAAPPASLKALVSARCASCHAGDVAEKKGAGFVILGADGAVPPFSLAEKKRILRLVGRGEMPKDGPPLTETEKQALVRFLNPEVQP